MSGPGTPSETPGHHALSDLQVEQVKQLRVTGEFLNDAIENLAASPEIDKRWLAIARTHFQEGMMAAVRAVTRPEFRCDDRLQYHQNIFQAFDNGVELDLRARIAVDLLKSQAANLIGDTQVEDVTPKGIAEFFLNLADALITGAAERGWAKDLPDTDELSAPMKKHIARNVRAQVYQQTVGQRIAAEDTSRVAVMPAGGLPAGNAGRQ